MKYAPCGHRTGPAGKETGINIEKRHFSCYLSIVSEELLLEEMTKTV